MTHNLTNLLPKERERTLRRVYFLRLGVVAISMLAGVVVVHGVLLFPSYLFLQDLVRERTEALAAITAALAGTEEQQVSARVTSLAEDASYLARLEKTPKISAAVSALIALPRAGIALTGFSFAPSQTGATMNLSGVASTREALRSYEETLRTAPFITGVDLPISAYAKERDIEFTVTLVGPFLP